MPFKICKLTFSSQPYMEEDGLLLQKCQQNSIRKSAGGTLYGFRYKLIYIWHYFNNLKRKKKLKFVEYTFNSFMTCKTIKNCLKLACHFNSNLLDIKDITKYFIFSWNYTKILQDKIEKRNGNSVEFIKILEI